MNILKQVSESIFNIVTEQTILSYVATETQIVIAQISMQGVIGTGSQYEIRFYIDNLMVVPNQSVVFNQTSGIVQSGTIVLAAGSTIRATVQGVAGDTSVTIESKLIDSSPVVISDIIEALTETTIRPTTKILGPCRPRAKKKCVPPKVCPN